jgi:hypothetical protein
VFLRHAIATAAAEFDDYSCCSDVAGPIETEEGDHPSPGGGLEMQPNFQRLRWRNLAAAAVCALAMSPSAGCTLHRNLLLRWHLEFDCDDICDDEVPCSADDRCRCENCSRLGRAHVTAPGPTPAQLGHARFHPVPTKPVFPSPNGSDMADMGPPAPQWYERQHEPMREKGRIRSEPAIPLPDLEEIESPVAPLPNSGWDVGN